MSDQYRREQRKAIRERRIRRRMLTHANEERGNDLGGWLTVRYLLDILQASTMQEAAPDREDHAADLVRDLISSEFFEERDDREFPATDAFRLDTWSVRVTANATALLSFVADPHPLIEDPRRK